MPHSSEEQSLSYNQQALWFATRLDSTAYNLAYGFRLRGALEPELLRRALALLVERHPVLRTTFSDTEHGARRVVHPRMDFDLQHVERKDEKETLRTAARSTQRPPRRSPRSGLPRSMLEPYLLCPMHSVGSAR